MATATTNTGAAPWRASFLNHVEDMDAPNFVLSTLHTGEKDSTSSGAPQFAPRARTVVYRGMWTSLPVNPKNTAELNPDVYESDLLTITTDDRMDKVPQLFSTSANGSAVDASESSSPQSRPAGPVEAVFWMPKVMTQWRFRGRAIVIGPDIEDQQGNHAREALTARMRRRSGKESEDDKQWSWSRELTAHFGNLSPGMRGSFRNPPPGTVRREGETREGYTLGQKVEDLEDDVARRHFRVVAIVPDEVDQVDLTDPADGRRWNYKYVASDTGGSWEAVELWP